MPLQLGDFAVLFSFQVVALGHINHEKARALLRYLQWVLRSLVRHSTWAVVFVDSRVVVGAVAKGRSGSAPLNRLLRHLAIGAELDLGDGLRFRFGYHHRRRQELRLANAPGTAGFAWGLDLNVRRFQVAIARNTYHTAGASTHLALRTRLTTR